MQGDGSSNHDYLHPKKKGGAGASSAADAERIRIASQYLQGVRQMREAGLPEHQAAQQAEAAPGSTYPYNKPVAQASQPQAAPASSSGMASASANAARMAGAAAGKARADDARMLRDMFQAVFPDLAGVKMWGSATRVASMTGSLSLSVAFFGFVYYMSTRYDAAKEGKPADGKDTA
mmetsp:Transcript_25631/g.65055  ORF Transcript_25631/g.65055 Transcript_25631/m.65055 type:complete len:177 (-) Transcript_25631:205-735(-)|eukprot:CAMPEP_0202867482 /NCGR_PEP_ID=MMETSP1391-20130828/9461_1 /ASSEMBLY_ACC=CAM_ASM_000867 /TAXON_ID=1034604 /ORGANISM="Chlamydomonas leiostraca, Strain SAG 11-49" /LENGTH=176 /DNA_ID=CAMNT_0049547531 /DNA_START=212 /DNA_END=742 /DNA_ORIENTATION=+